VGKQLTDKNPNRIGLVKFQTQAFITV